LLPTYFGLFLPFPERCDTIPHTQSIGGYRFGKRTFFGHRPDPRA